MRRTVLILCLTALVTAAAQANDASSSLALHDSSCAISQSSYEKRLDAVEAQLAQTRSDIETATESFNTFNDDIGSMEKAYTAADICDGISTLASIAAGGGIIKSLVKTGSVEIFGATMALRAATTSLVIRGGVIAGGTWVVMSPKDAHADTMSVRFKNKTISGRSIDELISGMYDEAKDYPLIPASMPFLDSAYCSGQGCPMYQAELEEMWEDLGAWHDAADAEARKADHWYEPEWISHAFGNHLKYVDLPYARNVLKLLRLNLGYYQLLEQQLIRDKIACY